MAITKILNIKETSGNPGRHLYNSVRYIMNPEKTGDGLLVGGNAGSEPWEVYSTMLDTKNAWGKTLGRQGYHFVISWKPGEADEQRAYAVAREFCEEYLGDSYDYVFAIHNDQGHMHGHIVFNSVNRDNGYKYRYEKGDWERHIQPVTDKVCERHGLPRLEYDPGERAGKSYAQWGPVPQRTDGVHPGGYRRGTGRHEEREGVPGTHEGAGLRGADREFEEARGIRLVHGTRAGEGVEELPAWGRVRLGGHPGKDREGGKLAAVRDEAGRLPGVCPVACLHAY